MTGSFLDQILCCASGLEWPQCGASLCGFDVTLRISVPNMRLRYSVFWIQSGKTCPGFSAEHLRRALSLTKQGKRDQKDDQQLRLLITTL